MNFAVITIVITGVMCFTLTVFRGIDIKMIFNLDAILIVIGGTITALFIGFPFKRITLSLKDIVDTFIGRRDREDIAADILDIAKIYRRADIKTLENRLKNIKDDFLRLGGNLLINHNDSSDIRNIMERELAIRIVDYNFSQNMLRTIARLMPSLGLAGTVISLIKMFKNVQSVEAMAPLMAVALMSTFYGVIISNLIILPISAKLNEKVLVSETLMNITIDGIVAVNDMEHPLKIEQKIMGSSDIKVPQQSVAANALAVNKSAV